MEFKSSQVAFKSKNNFTDDMKRFVIDEAARFTTDGNEAASASLDEMAEKAVRLSEQRLVFTITTAFLLTRTKLSSLVCPMT